jgi:hypothetical protein
MSTRLSFSHAATRLSQSRVVQFLMMILAGTAILATPAVIDRQPYIYWDAGQYISVGQSILKLIDKDLGPEDSAQAAPSSTGARTALPGKPSGAFTEHASLSYIGCRSPLYGLLAALSALTGSFWPLALLQDTIGAALILLVLTPLGGPLRFWRYVAAVTALTLFSGLARTSNLSMPDIFVSYALLASLLLQTQRRVRSVRGAFLCLVCFAGTQAHSTNAPIVLLSIPIALLWHLRRGTPWLVALRAAAAPGVAVGLAILFGIAFNLAIFAVVHETVRPPPYLTARLLADGPGRHFITKSCRNDHEPFFACKAAKLRFDTSDDLLWSVDPAASLYTLSSETDRKRMRVEDFRFAAAVVSTLPAEVFQAAASNAWREFWTISTEDTRHYAASCRDSVCPVSTKLAATIRSANIENIDHPPPIIADMQTAITFLSMGGFVILLLRRMTHNPWAVAARLDPSGDTDGFIILSIGLLLIFSANGALCGALSGVYARYQARLAWLFPLMAVVWILAAWDRRAGHSPSNPRPALR